MPIVNGMNAECGCYVEGHWGQYGPDHLADQAEGFGWRADGDSEEYPNEGYSNDPRYWRRVAETFDARADRGAADPNLERHWRNTALNAWEAHVEASDAIEAWLNDRTEDGYVWHWHDGEFYLSPLCEDGDCDDETCAHWD